MLNIVPKNASPPASELHVVTADTSAQIPDPIPSPDPRALSPMTEYRWFVDEFGSFNGIDAAAGPSGLLPPGGGSPIPSDARVFTTPP